MRLCTQHHIVQSRQCVNQHEVLMHHADAGSNCVVRIADIDKLPRYRNGAGVGPVEAIQNGHQGTFTGTVFTYDGMYGTRRDTQFYIGIGSDRTKTFADAAQMYRKCSQSQYLQALSAM